MVFKIKEDTLKMANLLDTKNLANTIVAAAILGFCGFIFHGVIQLKSDVAVIKEVLVDELAKAEKKIESLEQRTHMAFNRDEIGPELPYDEQLKAKLY